MFASETHILDSDNGLREGVLELPLFLSRSILDLLRRASLQVHFILCVPERNNLFVLF
jgi:hypothetical protein